MRAVVLPEQGEPEKLVIQEVAVPTPGPREVLIKVQYCGVDGHDQAVRKGIRRRGFIPGSVLGHEISGTVVEVGSEVGTLKPGDRVCTMAEVICGTCEYCRAGNEALCLSTKVIEGGLAQYVACPESSVFLVPEGVAMTDAAVAACAIATPYHALVHAAEVKPGETVLVTGAGGGLGIHAIQLIGLFGARAIGWTRSESKRAALESAGADDVICGRGETKPVWQQLLDLTQGKGVDVVIDTVGSAAFYDAFRALARQGRYVMLGELVGENAQINPAFVFAKRAKIVGIANHDRHEVIKILELIKEGKIKPVIGGVYPLDDVQKVHALLDQGAVTGRAVMAL